MALTVQGPLLDRNQQSAGQSAGRWDAVRARLPGAAQRAAEAAKVAAAAPTAATLADAGMLRSSVADILGLRAQATVDEASARASELSGQGAIAEAEARARGEEISAEGLSVEAAAFGVIGGIAGENARTAGIAGSIRQLQAARASSRTIGSQRASIASAGFGAAGTSVDLLRASLQEGMLSDQLIRTQTSLTQGGYLEEGAAADAQAAGAEMASASARGMAQTHRELGTLLSNSALEMAKSQRAAGTLATANAAAQTAALGAYISSTQNGTPLTPAQQLALGTLASDPSIAGSFSPEALGVPEVPAVAETNAARDYVNPLLAPRNIGIAGQSNVIMSV